MQGIENKKVCIIGAGPSGMATMIAFSKAKQEGQAIPQIVCYEKQSEPGGLWNYTWRTGVDAHGEPVHGSMYRQLFANAPKECLEFPNYTFKEHYGKPVGSYPPRDSLHNYILTRFRSYKCEDWIKGDTIVKNVQYNDFTGKFQVRSRTLKEDHDLLETFDYVVVASGHFSTPSMVEIPGFIDFKGRIVHAHDMRNAQEFKYQDILVVGTSYSAEDIASMCWKNGCKSVTCSWRSKPMPYDWPKNFTTKPILTNVSGDTVTFKDGTKSDFDTIIMCTGYLHCFPFMDEALRLVTPNVPYPAGLYKNIFWQSNPKLMYVGMQAQAYTLPMFDAEAWYLRDAIMGKIQIPNADERGQDIQHWIEKQGKIDGTVAGFVDFQGAYVKDLIDATDYTNIDVEAINKIWVQWRVDKEASILNFRDKQHISVYSGDKSTVPKIPWKEQYDFSDEGFINNQVHE